MTDVQFTSRESGDRTMDIRRRCILFKIVWEDPIRYKSSWVMCASQGMLLMSGKFLSTNRLSSSSVWRARRVNRVSSSPVLCWLCLFVEPWLVGLGPHFVEGWDLVNVSMYSCRLEVMGQLLLPILCMREVGWVRVSQWFRLTMAHQRWRTLSLVPGTPRGRHGWDVLLENMLPGGRLLNCGILLFLVFSFHIQQYHQ